MNKKSTFDWDNDKNKFNKKKHGISFSKAQRAFADPNRIIEKDIDHSTELEDRYFCYGKTKDEVITIRFTYRNKTIRIFGAGYWRKGKKIYEKENNKIR